LALRFWQDCVHATSSAWHVHHKFFIVQHQDSVLNYFLLHVPTSSVLCARTCKDHMHIESLKINVMIVMKEGMRPEFTLPIMYSVLNVRCYKW
jgi:hypothetical protein